MSNLKNKVQLIGFIGKDPEIRNLSGGKIMGKFSLATTDSYKNSKGERMETTSWHNLVVWGKQAEFAEKYIKKGSELAVEGKLVSRNYEDKDGKKVYTTEIWVSEIVFMNRKQK
jgi:single-strand DNA-binding protein